MTRCQTEQFFSISNSTQAGSKGCYWYLVKDQNELNIFAPFSLEKLEQIVQKFLEKVVKKIVQKLLRKIIFTA